MWDEIVSALRQATSLDPQPDQGIGQTAAEFGAGFIPGVGQAMAVRDIERARRDNDPVGMGLAAAGLIPGGQIAKALRGAKSQIIAGKTARHAPIQDMELAEAAEKAGMKPEEIWRKFGWERGKENHAPWKFEIPDQNAMFHPRSTSYEDLLETGLADTDVKSLLSHPELLRQYPEIGDYALKATMNPGAGNAGSFNPITKTIRASGRDESELMSTLMHELQHGVQALEGFDRGANYATVRKQMEKKFPGNESVVGKAAMSRYLRNMGENEARAVETRLFEPRARNATIMPTTDYEVADRLLLDDMAVYGFPRK